ncbi:MAG: SirB2 family protein [Sphingobacteriales bacterium]|nr:SirB2 family protein [Sphingobacteriales bacterium]
MEIIKNIHIASAGLFLLDYVIKTILLLIGSSSLEKYKKVTKVPSMVISTAFLVTGIYLIAKIGMGNVGGWFHLKVTLTVVGVVLGIIGFKKNSKVLAIISTILFLYIYGLSETKDVKLGIGKPGMGNVITDTANANYDLLAHGKGIYNVNCLKCHGENGQAGVNGAANLTASMCENRGLVGIIRNGRKLMPAFKDLLNEQEVTAVAEYVKSLRVYAEEAATDSTTVDSTK